MKQVKFWNACMLLFCLYRTRGSHDVMSGAAMGAAQAAVKSKLSNLSESNQVKDL